MLRTINIYTVFIADLGSNSIPALTALDVDPLVRVGNKVETQRKTTKNNENNKIQGGRPGLTGLCISALTMHLEIRAKRVEDQMRPTNMLLFLCYCCCLN